MKDYFTVTQYAKLTGKDPGNIRRLLGYGKLVGEKLGNQWIIPTDTKYPEDGRVKSGNYRNWRKKTKIEKEKTNLMELLHQMSHEFEHIYGDHLIKIVLYGSYARGEQTEESDIDIAVLLKDGDTEEMHDAMTDIVVDCELDQGITFSVISLDYDQYENWKKTLPFYMNLEREGIILWKQRNFPIEI